MKASADRVAINNAPVYGSIGPEFTIQGQPCLPLRFWTDGSIAVNFVQLKMTSGFASLTARQELFEKLNAIPGVMLKADANEKQGFFRLAALSADQGASFLKAMDWMAAKLRAPAALAA